MAETYTVSKSPNGASSLTLRGNVPSQDRKSLQGEKFSCLFVRHGDHTDIDYLESTFDEVRILDVGSEHFDWDAISRMRNLERLSIGAYWKVPWKTIKSRQLQSLTFTWDKSYLVSDLNFPGLKHLKLVGRSDEGIDELASLNTITYLDLVDSRNLRDLRSLGLMNSLLTLRLRGAPKLASLEGVQTLRCLVSFHLEGLKKIEAYDALSSLKSLKGLVMRGCAPVNSLAFLAKLPKLEILVLGDTKVGDGDLKAVTSFPSMKKVMFKNKRGYNWTAAQANAYFEELSGEKIEYSRDLEDALKMKL